MSLTRGDITDALGDCLVGLRLDLPVDDNQSDEIRTIVHRGELVAVNTETGKAWRIELSATPAQDLDGNGILADWFRQRRAS